MPVTLGLTCRRLLSDEDPEVTQVISGWPRDKIATDSLEKCAGVKVSQGGFSAIHKG